MKVITNRKRRNISFNIQKYIRKVPSIVRIEDILNKKPASHLKYTNISQTFQRYANVGIASFILLRPLLYV